MFNHSSEIYHNNLDELAKNFAVSANKTIDIFSPFITLSVLKVILSDTRPGVRVSILTRWKISDFLMGSASLELFDYCLSTGWVLYINPRIHLKTVVRDYHDLLLGSANITGRGLGLLKPENYEVLTYIRNPSSSYLLFLEQIKAESAIVTPLVVARFRETLERLKLKFLSDFTGLADEDERLHTEAVSRDFFLTSELPMCEDISLLYLVVQNPDIDLDNEILSTARHDIAKYALWKRSYKSENEFREYLAYQFLTHPFIQALCNFIDRPRRFGEIRAWVQRVCTDVPVPTRRSLSDNVNVLYDWLVILGEEQFITYRPNHTELIAPRN
ncbi:phospholipase D-like domain-containing protein [Almyronema epifaneia]|uniref:Phosphatidylserine/phosphatidylglycerophosphate/ cardiolipin synthase family protein n=1 Tax=Almyronema epifaneia S1 TaxID=2991925 RepID=A0ABW6IDP1_9CYAN